MGRSKQSHGANCLSPLHTIKEHFTPIHLRLRDKNTSGGILRKSKLFGAKMSRNHKLKECSIFFLRVGGDSDN